MSEPPEGIQEVKFRGPRSSKLRGKITAIHRTTKFRKDESEREQAWNELWDSAVEITAKTDTAFPVQFLHEVYLGRRGVTICAAVIINGKEAFLILDEDWLKMNDVDYDKVYQCKRTSKRTEAFYREIPIYVVVVVKEEKKAETNQAKKEEIPAKSAIPPESEHITEVIITNLKTEITFKTIEDSNKALCFVRRMPVSDKEERETEELRKKLCLWEVTWVVAKSTLLYFHGQRKEEEECKEYRTAMISFLKRIDFNKEIASNDVAKKEKEEKKTPKYEVAKTKQKIGAPRIKSKK